MSQAIIALQTAAVAALTAAPGLAELTGIYDGPPPGARFPWISINGVSETDWSTKTATGREIRFGLTLWEDTGEALRLYTMLDAVAGALADVPRDLPGWRVASAHFLRSLIARDPAGPWAGLIEYRFRLLAA